MENNKETTSSASCISEETVNSSVLHSEDCGCDCGHEHAHGHAHGDGESTCGCGHKNEHADEHTHAHSCNDGEKACSCGCGHEHAHTHGHADSKDACGCGCGHEHGAAPEKDELRRSLVFLGLSVLLVIAGRLIPPSLLPFPFFWPVSTLSLVCYLAAYLLVGREVVANAFRNILHGHMFDENLLMTVATFGAFILGDFTEGVAVMIFYSIGETLQDMAVAKSRNSIAALMDIRPEFARVVRDGEPIKAAPETVEVGETIVIQPGERIPLDCAVLTGESSVDASALTGESVPVAAAPGVALASGSVNLSGVLTCRVSATYGNSTVQKILDLVSESSGKKAQAEKFITRFARVYTPIVMGGALLLAVVPPLFLGFSTFGTWFYRALIFLVVSCPCALVVSVPVGFLAGIGGAARGGILVKGGDVIDRLAAPRTAVFDKTGTLTEGRFAVQSVVPAAGVTEEELLRAAALCERSSGHPIALSVRAYCGDKDPGIPITQYEEKPGHGILATAEGDVYAAGNARLMQLVGAQVPAQQTDAATVLMLAEGTRYLGMLRIADQIKPGAAEAIARLKALGVQQCCMLTGDNAAIAGHVAEAVKLDQYKAGLLPHEKVSAFEALTAAVPGVSLYAGDGINDAPLLARADVGIAMGGVGSDAAIEAADVVLMTDEVGKIADAVVIARKTRRIVQQNIIFALGVKGIILLVAALGYAPMWLAIFGDVGVALLAIANSMRAMRVRGD